MTQVQAKKIIEDDLTPRYERARDSRIDYTIKLANQYHETKAALQALFKNPKNKFGMSEQDKPVVKALSLKMNGKLTNAEKGIREGGLVHKMTSEEYKIIVDKELTDKQIKALFTVEFKEILKTLIEAICEDIKKFNPKEIETRHSEHDINFTLTNKEGKHQSYTINTIVDEEDIQAINNRTLRKLHNKII